MKTTWTVGLVPPDRSFPVGVEYVAEEGCKPLLLDQILIPSGAFHDRADALLDYIESAHIKQGRSIVSVTSDGAGDATINFAKSVNIGFFETVITSDESATYDDASRTWR